MVISVERKSINKKFKNYLNRKIVNKLAQKQKIFFFLLLYYLLLFIAFVFFFFFFFDIYYLQLLIVHQKRIDVF